MLNLSSDSLTSSLSENKKILETLLPIGISFDFVTKELLLGSTRCFFLGINGLCDMEFLQRILADLQVKSNSDAVGITDLTGYLETHFSYVQSSLTASFSEICNNVLSGPCALLVEGFSQAILLDLRQYPKRSIEEPDTERIIRGSKDGFVETLVTNTNLLRRRLRSPKLTFETISIGTMSKTDVAVSYLSDRCDTYLLENIKKKLSSLDVSVLTMGAQSLRELLVEKEFFHPLPNFFLTERPDVACSYLSEGYILLLIDNSPFAMVLPCTIFQFTQSPEDYYKSPLIGTYLRFVRFLCLVVSLFLMPLFLYFSLNPDKLPFSFHTLIPSNTSGLQVFIYVLFVEFGLDLFKYASAHSADGFSGSFGIVGGLLIGDMAISLQWASAEVIFYGAATMLATLGLVNVELGDAIKLYRLFLILLVGFFPTRGLFVGIAVILLSVITTPAFGKKSYFWPLFPFHWKALRTLLFREPTFLAQPEKKKTPL